MVAVASLGAGALGRLGAVGDAATALAPLAKGDAVAAGKVSLEDQYRYWPKGVASSFAKTGELPKVSDTAIRAQFAKTVLRTPRPHDVVTDEGIVRPGTKSPLGNVRRHLPGALGRDLRAQTNIETSLLQAPGHAVASLEDTLPAKTGRLAEKLGLPEKLTVGRGKLTKYQEHAAFIHLSGHTPAEWARASDYAIENADALARELEPHADAAMLAKVADEIRSNHEALTHMTKNAARYFDSQGQLADPKVIEAANKMRVLTAAREKLIGMDESAVHHSLGSHWYALERLLGGHDYHGELARLEATPEATGANIERLQKQLQEEEARFLPVEAAADPAKIVLAQRYVDQTSSRLQHLEDEIAGNKPRQFSPGVAEGELPGARLHAEQAKKLLAQARSGSGTATGFSMHDAASFRRISELKTALEEAQTAQKASTNASERAAQIHEMFRQKGAESGASYLPYQSKRAPLLSRQGMGQIARGEGRYGIGPPKGEAVHAFEGKSLVRGDIRTKASALAGGAYRNAAKLSAQEALHERLWNLAKPERASKTDVPIRDTLKIPDHLRESVNRLYEGGLSPAEESKLTRDLWEENTKPPQPGEHVRFVPRRLYKQTAKPVSPNAFLRGIDRAGTTYRASRYLTPLYGKWFAQNAGIGVVQQGVFMPANMVGFLKGFRELPEGDIHAVEAGMGGGVGKSLTEGTTSHVVQSLAHFWHNVDDRVFRGASFWHEARSEGFKTPEDIHRLLTDEALHSKKIAVFRRARESALDYTLTPKERAMLKPLFAWYPWLKASTRYALTFPLHHPLQQDLYSTLGQEADNRTKAFFASVGGLVPSWMAGDLPFGSKGRFTVGGLGPAETPVGVAQALVDTLRGRYHPIAAELQVNPAIRAAVGVAGGYDINTQKKTTVPQIASDFVDQYAPKFWQGVANGQHGWAQTGFVPYAATDFPTAARQGESEAKGRLRGVEQVAAYTQANLQQLRATPNLNPTAVAQIKQAILLDGRYSTEMMRAGATGDTPYDAIQTLAYKSPEAYYVATVSALPGVTPAAVANAKKGIDAAIASGNYTAKDITAAADKLWEQTGVWRTLGEWHKLTAPKLTTP